MLIRESLVDREPGSTTARKQCHRHVDAVERHEHDRHLQGEVAGAVRRAETEDRRHDEAERADHEHRCADPQSPRVKMLLAMPHPTGDERQTEADEQVGENGPCQRGLHHSGKAMGEGDATDDQLGQVVQRRVEQPADRGPKFRREPLRGGAHDADEREDRDERCTEHDRRMGIGPFEGDGQRHRDEQPQLVHIAFFPHRKGFPPGRSACLPPGLRGNFGKWRPRAYILY